MKHWTTWIILLGVGVCLASGCAVVASLLRGAADLAESPAAEAVVGAAADSVGLGWLWTALGALGLTGAAGGEAVRRAKRNGAFVDVMATTVDALKTDKPDVAKIVTQAISAAMRDAGRDGQFDAFLDKLGRNGPVSAG